MLLASVIIPTQNRLEVLPHTLEALTRQSLLPEQVEVIVIDDGSTDGTVEWLQEAKFPYSLRWESLEPSSRFCPVRPRNRGLTLARSEIAIFLDADVLASPDLLTHHVDAHGDRSQPLAVIGYTYGYAALPEQRTPEALRPPAPDRLLEELSQRLWEEGDLWQDGREPHYQATDDLRSSPAPWSAFWTNNVSVPTRVALEVGGFDEEFVGWGLEDLEFAYRLDRHGVRFRLARGAWGVHAPHPVGNPLLRAREFARNRRRMLAKHPQPLLEAYFWGWPDWQPVWDTLRELSSPATVGSPQSEAPRIFVRQLRPLLQRLAVDEEALLWCGSLPQSEVGEPLRPQAQLLPFLGSLRERPEAAGRETPLALVGLLTPWEAGEYSAAVVAEYWQWLPPRLLGGLLAELLRVAERAVLVSGGTGARNGGRNGNRNAAVSRSFSAASLEALQSLPAGFRWRTMSLEGGIAVIVEPGERLPVRQETPVFRQTPPVRRPAPPVHTPLNSPVLQPPLGNGVLAGAARGRWSLAPPAVRVYVCDKCGASHLQPEGCCGTRPASQPAAYYVGHGVPGRSPNPEFSVVLLTKNHLALTRTAVESLRRATGDRRVEYLFVDCASTDGTLHYIRDLAREEAVRLIVTPPEEPFIYARNCNRGAELARGRYLLFANNDIEAQDPELFPKLARALQDPRTGAVGTRTDYECHNELQSRAALPAERVWSRKPVMGFFWGMRREVFFELGGLDEAFQDYGCDEIDFQYRLIQRNYRIAVIDSLVHHETHATFSEEQLGKQYRNLERFEAKHGVPVLVGDEWYGPFEAHQYPLLSVAITTRNYGRYLPRALDSALGNRLPSSVRLQLVVADDASTDDTAGILAQYRARYPDQISLVPRATSSGPAAAKNAALNRCIGEYVALLDADDEFTEYKLARSLDVLTETGANFLYHDYVVVAPDGRLQPGLRGPWSPAQWRAGRNLPPSTWVFQAGVVRFNEQYPSAEDPEFLRRRWRELRAVYLPEILTRYHAHEASLSTKASCRVLSEQLREAGSVEVSGCTDWVPSG